jgi:hypothetical protein
MAITLHQSIHNARLNKLGDSTSAGAKLTRKNVKVASKWKTTSLQKKKKRPTKMPGLAMFRETFLSPNKYLC